MDLNHDRYDCSTENKIVATAVYQKRVRIKYQNSAPRMKALQCESDAPGYFFYVASML